MHMAHEQRLDARREVSERRRLNTAVGKLLQCDRLLPVLRTFKMLILGINGQTTSGHNDIQWVNITEYFQ